MKVCPASTGPLLEKDVHLKKHSEFSNFRSQQLSRTRDHWPPAAAAGRGLFLTFYTFIGGTNPVTSIRLACLWLNEAPVQPTSSGPHARVVCVHAREANVPGDDTFKTGTGSTLAYQSAMKYSSSPKVLLYRRFPVVSMETVFRICVGAELHVVRSDLFVVRSPSTAKQIQHKLD